MPLTLRVIALLSLVAGLTIPVAQAADVPRPEFRVIAYLPEYRGAGFDIDQARPLTDLVVFAATASEDGTLDTAGLRRFPWSKARQLKKETRARLILCVGGWGRSKGFPAVAADAAKRKAF